METKNRVVKGSKVPSINLSKEILSLLIRLEDSESKEILVGIRDYVYKDKEPSVSEDVEDIMEMVLDNVNYIASKHLNGKKGGRKPKNNTELQPNTDFENEAKNSPNEAIKPQDDIVIPQEDESVSEGPKQGEFDDIIDTFESNIKEDEYMENYSNIAVAECRAEVQEFNSERVMGWLEQNYPYLLSRMNNLPSKALTIDENMKRMRESLHGTMKDIFKNNETLINSIYIYIINNKLKQ